MTANRFWVGIVVLCSIVAFATALAIATVGTAVFASGETPNSLPVTERSAAPAQVAEQSAGQTQAYEGVITDSRCGAKHQSSIGKTASDCTRACVHAGSQFALVDGDKSFLLDGEPAQLKKAAGTRVTITGMLRGTTITVSSVAAGL